MITFRDIIQNQQPKSLGQQDKALIYKSFLQKRERKNSNRWSLVYKTFAYGLSTLSVVGFVLFGNIFGIFDTNPTQLSQSVDAQSIGSIVSSQGTFAIYNRENRKIDTDTIQLSDRVIVDKASTIKVLINDSFTAQIVGPAQFEIIVDEDKNNKNYNIKFMNGGDYVAIDSVNNSEKNHISVQTRDGMTIKKNQNDLSKKVSFAIQTKPGEDNKTITNKSSSTLEVTTNTIKSGILGQTTIENTNSIVTIKGEQIVELTTQGEKNETSIKIISQENIISIDKIDQTKPTKKPQNSEIIQEKPQTITDEDIKKIESNLYKSFVQKDYNDIVVYYFAGKQNEYNITIKNLNDRLNRLAQIVNIDNNTDISLGGIVAFAQQIQDHYKTLHIPQKTYNNLTSLTQKLKEINKHNFGIIKPTNKEKPLTIEYIYTLIDLQQNNTALIFR